MHTLQHFHESGAFAAADLTHVASLTNDGVLASLSQDYPGWEVVRILSRTSRYGVVLFQKTDQAFEYMAHEIPGSYANLSRFTGSEPVRETCFNGLGTKFDGLNSLAEQGWSLVDAVDSGVLFFLLKRPVQKEADRDTEGDAEEGLSVPF